MAAIAAQGFADKNETIDWLRAQGIPFARASWLERIHSNGGRPIYLHQPPKAGGRGEAADAADAASRRRPRARRASARSPTSTSCWRRARATGRSTSCWRPRSAAPSPASPSRPRPPTSRSARPREFAAVTLHATELRLGLDLGDRAFDAQVQKPRMRGPGPAISHMLVLTDARQVNADLLNLIKAANARVNG